MHRHRVLAHGYDDAEGGAEFHADGANGVEQRLILTRLSSRRHPVGRQFDVAQGADARAGDVRDGFRHRHAARCGGVDERKRRPLTHRHRLAGIRGVAGEGNAGIGDWHLPRADHLVAVNQARDAAVANRDKEPLAGHGRHAQHALRRVGDGDRAQRQGRTFGRLPCKCPLHTRRLAEEHGERQIDGRLTELTVVDMQRRVFQCLADHRERTALAGTDRLEGVEVLRVDCEDVALLRLVAPDLERRQRRVGTRNTTQVDACAASAVLHQLRQRVRQSAGANVVNEANRVVIAELPAAVDHLLAAVLHLGVVPLHRGKVEVGIARAGGHRRRGAAAEAD